MQAPLKEKDDIKIFILYLLRHINYPLEFTDINDIVVQDGLVNYFDFADCFAELLETENIREDKSSGVAKYSITTQGIHVADNLKSNLLGMIRERSLKNALRLLSFKERGSEIVCKSETGEDGKYILHCKIIEEKNEIFSLDLKLDNKNQLDIMKYNFNDRPEFIYKGLISLLSGDADYLLN